MKTSTIKPGVLVSLKTTLSGGVNYKRVDLDPDHATDTGGRFARWETVREIVDANEYEQATAARSLARGAVVKVCHASSFGLLCPSEREPQLIEAIANAIESRTFSTCQRIRHGLTCTYLSVALHRMTLKRSRQYPPKCAT